MHCQVVAVKAICTVLGVITRALKSIKTALTSFETVGYMNRCGVGPRLAKMGAMTIRTHGKKPTLTLGEFIAGAYRAWGRRRAKGLVWLAVNARLVEFRRPQRLEISEE